jgi:hypothetical protein
MFPGRFNFPGWVRDQENKSHEGLAQFVLVGFYSTGELMSLVVLDGAYSDVKSAKYLPLSSKTDFTFDKNCLPVPIDAVAFHEDGRYREELMEKYGIRVGSRKIVKYFDQVIKSWNLAETEYGDIYTPNDEERIKLIAAKVNQGFTFKGRIVLKNRMVISINPAEMAIKASLTLFEARKYEGFNPNHAQMAEIVDFIGRFRLTLIQELNKKISEKDAEIIALRKTAKKERKK